MRWSDLVDPVLDSDIVRWRRHLHANPELSSQEVETTAFVEEKLRSWGIETERPLGTGVIGRIGRGKEGAILGLRADLDALPIQELRDDAFVSTRAGVMHACGHDGHTAMLLGVAKVLSERSADIPREVRLVFQPAEEVVESGALALLKSGVLDDIDMMFGLHLWSGYETGKVSAPAGPMMASTDRFTIRVEGVGGHGAQPHQAIDSTLVAAEIVCALQTIVSRRIDPVDPAVVSVGMLNSGTAFNIISPFAEIVGTTRALNAAVRQQLEGEIRKVAGGTAAAFGASVNVDYVRGNPALVNDDSAVLLLGKAAALTVGSEHVFADRPMMGGEDFAYYCERMPSAFAMIGARNASLDAIYPHHHPKFAIDERALGIGTRVFLETVGLWMNQEMS